MRECIFHLIMVLVGCFYGSFVVSVITPLRLPLWIEAFIVVAPVIIFAVLMVSLDSRLLRVKREKGNKDDR